MSEHGNDRSGGPTGGGTSSGVWRGPDKKIEEVPKDRGSGWGQGSRFGASPQAPPEPSVPQPTATEEETPRRRRKKPEPKHPRYTVPVISGKVTIHRDAQGTPHIRAKQEHDAWAALGFCCAQDRLWQLDMLRRISTGRVAEILGVDWLVHDSLVRTAGVGRRAAVAAQRMQGVGHEMLTAYAGGVNAARALGQPPEATASGYEVAPWTAADSLSLELYAAWAQACRVWPRKLLAAYQRAVEGQQEGSGSEPDPRMPLWARLDPRTASWGAGLRVPDLLSGLGFVSSTGNSLQLSAQFSGPPGALGLPYAAHLQAPGLSVAGLTIPGAPNFFAGRNRNLAWMASPLLSDDVDVVMEELDGIGNFRGAEGREKCARRQELIRVRGGDDQRVEVVETRNGPLVSALPAQFDGAADDPRVSLAVRWGLNSLGTSLGGWLALARAETSEEARGAANLLALGPLGLELRLADDAGQEETLNVGKLPVRDPANQLAVRGWHVESRWKGARPLGAESLEDRAPDWASPSRGAREPTARARLRSLLEGETLDGPAAALVLSDVDDAQSRMLSGRLAEQLTQGTRGQEMLELWNGATVPDSESASFFWVLVLKFLAPKLVGEDELSLLLGSPAELVDRISHDSAGDPADLALIGSALREAAAEAEAFLEERYGNDWRWDRVCRVDRRHLLGREELFAQAGLPDRLPMGSPGAIFAVGLEAFGQGVRVVTEPCARMICDLGTSHAALIVAGGSSGVPTSVHFADQAVAFGQGHLTSFPVDADVEGELSELHP